MAKLRTLAGLLAVLPGALAVGPGSARAAPNAATPAAAAAHAGSNTTYTNPILPGFHPDPSCIHVADGDGNSNSPGTFFCVSSSFSAFPGIPIHASRDLQHWSLIGHVLNRRSQLPALVETNRSTSGIWAPTIRYRDGTFYVVTTLVNDERPQTDVSRWDNLIFQSDDPYDPAAWTDPTHFKFTGYDPSPFWDDNGKSYMVASHAWQVKPGIQLAEIDLDTGETEDWKTIWTGTGGLAPEGPHIYRKDGYYYLLIAEGGTGLNHMVTMARSKTLAGPYTPHPHNPVLTNANTTNYFQTVGHADLLQDAAGHWWAVALATRSGPAYVNYPMGRETVLTSVEWEAAGVSGKNMGHKNGSNTDSAAAAQGWPTFSPVRGTMSGPLPIADIDDEDDGDQDSYARELTGDDINFDTARHRRAANSNKTASRIAAAAPATKMLLPPHFTYWRPPVEGAYEIVPLPVIKGNNASWHGPNATAAAATALRVLPSTLNLTGLDGNYAGPGGQTFVGRRQQHTLFTFRVDLTYQPTVLESEAGVSVFLTQNHHLDLGLVRLEDPTVKNATTHPGGTYLRFRGITTGASAEAHLPAAFSAPVPASWHKTQPSSSSSGFRNDAAPLQVTLQIQAANATHYSFSAWPTLAESEMRTVAWASNEAVSWGFTGALLGVYCTSNGGDGSVAAPNKAAPVYVNRWQYTPLGQFRD